MRMPVSGTRAPPPTTVKVPSTSNASTNTTTGADVLTKPAIAFLRDGWDAPNVDVTFNDMSADRRREQNDRVRAGGVGPAFMPSGERLTGWHLLDGSAAAGGVADLERGAQVDIACLFAMGAARDSGSNGDHAGLLAKSSAERTFGSIRGAFRERLPMDAMRTEIVALVDDDVIADFLRTHTDPSMHRDLQAETQIDQALCFFFWMQVRGRGLNDARALAALEGGAPSANAKDAEFRAQVKACFVETLCDLLDRGQGTNTFETNLVERDLLKRSFTDDAVRLYDFVAARSRSRTVAANEPVACDALAAQMAAQTAQGLRRLLSEAALAADAGDASTVAAAVTRQRAASRVEPLVRDLLEELRGSVAWRKRDSDTAIIAAFAALLDKNFPGGTFTPQQFAARYGDDGVDLVLSLLRGGDDARTVNFRGARQPNDRLDSPSLVDALRSLGNAAGPRVLDTLSELEDIAGRADRNDFSHRGPFVVAPVTSSEQRALDNAPTVSLARLATALRSAPAAVTSLAPLVRARDSLTLDRATHSFPDALAQKVGRFFDDLEGAIDAKGGGTAATDVVVVQQAVLEVLAPLADASGVVSFARVREMYGSAAAAWFGIVASAVAAGVLGDADAGHGLSHVPSGLSEQALVAIGNGLPDVSFASRMPALDVVTEQFGGPDALAGFEVIVAQHLFPTTMGLVDALEKNGLPKDKLHLIGKSYSTHERTYAALLARGVDVDSSSRQDNNLAEDAAVRLAGAARRQLQKIFNGVTARELADPNARPRFLLFDEGGKLLETLHKEFPQYAKLCIGVEHTDRGMQMLDDLEKNGGEILLPVVDMARSLAKKMFESPAIGESVVFHAEIEMKEAGVEPSKKEACVIGYGAVGKATADALRRRGYQVWVHDTDPAALARAQADGCETPTGDAEARRAAALAHGHLLISCTGRTTITPDEFAGLLPNGAILTNAASGTHELGIHALGDEQLAQRTAPESLRSDGAATTTFRGAPIATGPFLAPGKHRRLVFESSNGAQHLVLRGGAVVNMTRGMPPEVVQLTLGLVLTSVLQAAKSATAGTTRPGRVALGDDEQKALVDAVEADLKKKGLPSLSHPDFRTVASWG